MARGWLGVIVVFHVVAMAFQLVARQLLWYLWLLLGFLCVHYAAKWKVPSRERHKPPPRACQSSFFQEIEDPRIFPTMPQQSSKTKVGKCLSKLGRSQNFVPLVVWTHKKKKKTKWVQIRNSSCLKTLRSFFLVSLELFHILGFLLVSERAVEHWGKLFKWPFCWDRKSVV